MPVDGDIILKAGLDTDDISKKMDTMQKTISRGLKNIIRIGFGVRSVFTLMRKLRKSLFEGFGDLSQVYEPFNSAMSQIMTSLRLLRNSFASAFAPIIETIAPALSTFINMMAEAVSKVGQFIAALTGKEYVQAGTAYIDYAKSLDKSSKSSSNATKKTKEQTEAQKKLNREITHFDDLVILHEKHENENTEPTTTTTSPTSTFTPMPIGDAVTQFAKDFKAAWAKADFTDIGRKLGEKLRTALEHIPWEKIQASTRKIAKSIATFLNGFLETPGLFTEIGTTVGEAINTALAGLSTFAWNFHWSSLGTAVGDAVYAALDTVNWDDAFSAAEGFGTGLADFLNGILNTPGLFEKIGTTVGNLINTRLAALNSFAWEFEWDKLGEAIQTTIISALDTINWPLVHSTVKGFAKGLAEFLNNLFTPNTFNAIGNTIAELLLTALDFLNTFGETFGWEDFGNSLASGLNTFLIKFTANDGPAKFGKGVYTFVVGIKNAIITWLDKVDWYAFGTTLRDIIQNIPWTTILKSFGEIIWHAIKAVINLAKGIFTDGTVGTPVVRAFENLKNVVDDIAENVNFEAIATAFGHVVNALKPAAEGFAVGFINVFTKLFEIGKVFLEALGPALEAMATALNKMDPDVLRAIGAALGIIAGALVAMKLAQGVGGIISGLVGPLANLATNAGNAASVLGSGSLAAGGTGLVGGLFMAASAAGAFLGTLEASKMTITNGDDELAEYNETVGKTTTALSDVGTELGLTQQQMMFVGQYLDNALNPALGDSSEQYKLLDKYLQDSGVDIETFRSGVKGVISESKDAYVVDTLSGYIDSVGTSSEDAEKDTSGLSDAFGVFDNLSITAPLKMLLLSTAIKNLGDAGLLSDEQVGNLQGTLDNYDPKHPETAINTVKDAFENAGIKADDFTRSVAASMAQMPRETQTEITKAVKVITDSGDDFKKESGKAGDSAVDGLVDSLEGSEKEVKKAGEGVSLFTLLGMNTGFDSNSPSKETKKIGGYAVDGLKLGLEESASKVKTAAETLAKNVVAKFGGLKDSLKTKGSDAMIGLYNGINSESTDLYNLARDIADDIYDGFDDQGWRTLGSNIGVGIYNGLISESSDLEILAWNTAVDMYNAACEALGIASPSKKFAWIGKMLMQGWQTGIADNSDSAVDAVSDVAGAMTDEAEDMNPAITISTSVEHWIDALNSVLTDFSETIVNRFDNLINTLVGLSSVSVGLPAIVQGKVIPSSITSAAHSSADASEMKNMLESLASQQITYDDLRAILVEVARDYMQTNFYLGDEQIARHANNGNLLLNRRYSTMKT